jgi:hypothetical protein
MRTFLTILAIPLLFGGCAGAGTSGGPSSSNAPSAAPSSAAKYSVATGADKLVLRLADEGGFVAPGFLLTRTPQFALYGDGRVIVPGPVDAISPGPLLPNLRQMHVTPDEIQKILAAADAAGLLGPDASYRATNIMDASTTVFTTIVAGKVHITSAYALSESGATGDSPDAVAQAKLLDFQGKIQNLAGFLGRPAADDQAYEPTGMEVFPNVAPPSDGSSPTPQVVTWPLAADPATGGQPTLVEGTRCILVQGTDLAKFLAVAKNANALTVWTAPSGRYTVQVRPLYPEESGCSTGAA